MSDGRGGGRQREVSISTRNPFAAVYVTCLGRADTDVARARRLLVVAVARCRNTATKLDGTAGLLLDQGKAPVIVEPVRVELKIDRPGKPTVHVLDHDGRRTPRVVPVPEGRMVLDGAEHKTIDYEIAYQQEAS